MTRRLAVLATIASLVPVAATATVPTRSLTGSYTAGSGNTIEVTQKGAVIDWVGRAGNGDWVHDFHGTLTGDEISGDFQDREGYPVHNKGKITAKVLDNCRIKSTSVQINGGPVESVGEIFRRDGPCVAHEPPGVRVSTPKRFHARGVEHDHGDTTTIALSGRFKADPDGDIRDEAHASGTMTLDIRWARPGPTGSDRWRVSLHGPGNFVVREKVLLVKLVAEIDDTSNARSHHRCQVDPFGTVTLTLNREHNTMFIEVRGLCGLSFEADARGAIVDE